MNQFLAESSGLKVAIAPVDGNTAAITGERISLGKGARVAAILNFADSTAATAVQVTLRQHNAATSGTSKDLDVANPYYHKVGAATVFTKVEPSVADALIDATALFADAPGLLVVEVSSDQLDTNNGFEFFSIDVADTGAAKLLSAHYVLISPRQSPAYSVAL